MVFVKIHIKSPQKLSTAKTGFWAAVTIFLITSDTIVGSTLGNSLLMAIDVSQKLNVYREDTQKWRPWVYCRYSENIDKYANIYTYMSNLKTALLL